MLDTLIKEKADSITYSHEELANISAWVSELKNIVAKQAFFKDAFIAGSYKRGTLVKGVSDVDVFIKYTGPEDPRTALMLLRVCLQTKYVKTTIKHNQPAVILTLDDIPFKLTLYKEDLGNDVCVSDDFLLNWRPANWAKLEGSVIYLKNKNPRFIDLIKILKLWNFNYQHDFTNAAIEERVCKLFQKQTASEDNLPEMMWLFFSQNRFQPVANKVFSLMKKEGNEQQLKREWLKFIDNKQEPPADN